MAMEVVGGAFLSASLQVLFADIHSVFDFIRRNKVNEELLNRLENKLLLANGVLDDAEKQQITNPNVRNWLEKLREAIHNTEDLIDEIKTAALRCQLEADRQMGFRVRSFFSSRFNVKDVERRIVKIIESVDDIVKDMKRLGLRECVQTSIPFQIQRSSLNILAKESDVYGRDADKEAIIKFLLSDGDEEGGRKISVMPIVGMGGIGKTTLAQLVYRDVIDGKVVMENPFVIKEWITVADESKSDVFTLTKAIYEAVIGPLDNTIKETFQLQLKLKDAMEGKRFLFVLDDVWNVDYQTWKDLQTPFESAANGSKIIVTTRLQKIARELGTAGSELDLALLSEDDGWKLFLKHAFNNVEPSSYPHLEEIGRKIVKKCKGNPLAVKSLGCLLHSQLNPKEWENVLVNDIWELELDQGEGGILPALWLSYYYLPPHLKRCFAYCSIIPKDYPFPKEKLILLWMAENLLQPQKNTMLEEVGEKYFEDLTSRSFFLADHEYGGFTMHDLVNDLAKFVSGESCLRLDDNCSWNLIKKTRHFSCMQHQKSDDIIKKFEDLSENKVLRTLLVLRDHSRHLQVVLQHIINPKQLGSMQYLRVLSASEIVFWFEGHTKLFKLIGRLKHLRYLDLSYNAGIKEIPDTICKLYNLQTLLLEGCQNLAKLPDSIGNLKHLRHLDLSDSSIEKIPDTICNLDELRTLSLAYCRKLTQLPTNISMLTNLCKLNTEGTSLKEMPPKISNLKNLQNLPEFVVGKSSGIEELGNLTSLQGPLHIRSLENVEEVEDVSKANLKNKNSIMYLSLEWNDESSDVSHNKAREVLDRLQPHTNIELLYIKNYGGRSFPDWMGHHSFCCITHLRLEGCKNCDRLPPLGELPSLEGLGIDGLDKVERIGDEFYMNDSSSSSPSFKSLKTLRFENMGDWKEWSSVDGAFPNLEELKLRGCPKLKGACLPDIYLPSLEHLDIRGCDKLFAHGNKWNLGMLTSLTSLLIENIDMEGVDSFPEEEGQLPTTLTSLDLCDVRNIKSLNGRALRHLTSLQLLQICNCQQLQCLPEERPPASLSSLNIMRCPLLKPRCQSERGIGQDWDNILHSSYSRTEVEGI